MSFTGKSPSETYKDIIQIDNSNSGVDSTSRILKTGEGSTTALSLSDRSLQVKSNTNNTTALDVQNKTGTSRLIVDTDNDTVKSLGTHVNTQYAYFGIHSGDAGWSGALANTHTAVPFANHQGTTSGNLMSLGTGTDPQDTFTIATYSDVIMNYWFVMDDITIDKVVWWSAADAATGDSATRSHLMSYTVETTAGTTSGDLSSSTVLADGSDINNAGYEQSYYQQMTIQSANVDAGKVILFLFRSDTINSDYSINASIKYHLT